MGDFVLTTYDWVPPPPRGFVRDIRVRWALEEAKLPYRVESVSFKERGPEHLTVAPVHKPGNENAPIVCRETGPRSSA